MRPQDGGILGDSYQIICSVFLIEWNHSCINNMHCCTINEYGKSSKRNIQVNMF